MELTLFTTLFFRLLILGVVLSCLFLRLRLATRNGFSSTIKLPLRVSFSWNVLLGFVSEEMLLVVEVVAVLVLVGVEDLLFVLATVAKALGLLLAGLKLL